MATNRILRFFDQEFMTKFFQERLLPCYPGYRTVRSIEIRPIKKNVWDTTYHVVIEYKTTIEGPDGVRVLPIFATAHSNEPRLDSFRVMKYLWQRGFAQNGLTIPHPLFYSQYYQASIYRGLKGENIYQFIRRNDQTTVATLVPLAARWLAKLHRLPADGAPEFNPENSRIRTVRPGVDHIYERIGQDYPGLFDLVRSAYDLLVEAEERYIGNGGSLALIHGDAHPENFIRTGEKEIGVIDFSDFCRADPARDVGAFAEQLRFMCSRKITDRSFNGHIVELFLATYGEAAEGEIGDAWELRVAHYSAWTALRTAIHFLVKDKPEPDRASPLLELVKERLVL